MALQKQNLNINFIKGLDTKTDPFQVSPGSFSNLVNSVFTKAGQLQKRNGYQSLPPAPDASTLTTFSGNLIATNPNINALLSGASQWTNQGFLQDVELSTLPLVRNSSSQTLVDSSLHVASNLLCTVFYDSTSHYQIQDATTGQVVISSVALPSGARNPRVFTLVNNFIIVFAVTITGTPTLRYIAIPAVNPSHPGSAVTISASLLAVTSPHDGFVANNTLFIAWNGADGGGAIRVTYLTQALVQPVTVTIPGYLAILISVTADTSQSTPVVWVTWYETSGTTITTKAFSFLLVTILAPTAVKTVTIAQLTSSATGGLLSVFYEQNANYSFAAIRSDSVLLTTVTQAAGVVTDIGSTLGVGLGSKSFLVDGQIYLMLAYGSANSGLLQPTYFLSDDSFNVIGKLAYSNGGGYYTANLPGVFVNGSKAYVSYLFKDLIASVNPQNLTPPNTTSNIYSQTGCNNAMWDFSAEEMINVEIAQSLHLASGILWQYDGLKPYEHGFLLFPEDITAVWAATGGSIHAQPDGVTNTNAYYYQVVYEWTDNQGNIHRSAPSIPLAVTTTGNGIIGSVVLNIPTLRLTYKSSVRITIYRWSVAQQIYYQVTSISSPTLNDKTVNSVTFTDTLADATILGNNIIYTTGGVAENIAAPGCDLITLFKSRAIVVDAEDRNLLWYSKQVIENTPVEFSDLFTIFLAPTIGATGSTGPITALAPMDDKLIIFKRNAIYYITGDGPDNTGANNDFSSAPIFITSSVGCPNPESIVLAPDGLMFQTGDVGDIWILGRDLSINYIGAPVESFTLNATVLSALTIPDTNQVRFTLSSGITLMYDYFFAQWGTFVGVPAISGTVYQGLHTTLNQYNLISQETPGVYIDSGRPVLMSFQTGWFNLSGIQGFERIYQFTILGVYYSPHKLNLQIAYDYKNPTQGVVFSPDNYATNYGDDPNYGAVSVYGGASNLEQFRVFTSQQKCQSFQISLSETYDNSFGVLPGAGLTLSSVNLVVGAKKGYVPLPAAQSIG